MSETTTISVSGDLTIPESNFLIDLMDTQINQGILLIKEAMMNGQSVSLNKMKKICGVNLAGNSINLLVSFLCKMFNQSLANANKEGLSQVAKITFAGSDLIKLESGQPGTLAPQKPVDIPQKKASEPIKEILKEPPEKETDRSASLKEIANSAIKHTTPRQEQPKKKIELPKKPKELPSSPKTRVPIRVPAKNADVSWQAEDVFKNLSRDEPITATELFEVTGIPLRMIKELLLALKRLGFVSVGLKKLAVADDEELTNVHDYTLIKDAFEKLLETQSEIGDLAKIARLIGKILNAANSESAKIENIFKDIPGSRHEKVRKEIITAICLMALSKSLAFDSESETKIDVQEVEATIETDIDTAIEAIVQKKYPELKIKLK